MIHKIRSRQQMNDFEHGSTHVSVGPGLRVSERIRQRLGSLSPSERKIARLLLSGPPTMGLESSARLAQHAGVSGPTISRFVTHQLGFENYAAFQAALREEISARMLSPVEMYRTYRVEQEPSDVLTRCATALGESVQSSVQSLDPGEFGRAVSMLTDRGRRITAVGGWFSHLAAGYLVAVLREVRPDVHLVLQAPRERAAAIADMGKKDVVAVFDFRRYERDTDEFARAVRAAGARIVLFTDPWLSPVAAIADALLPAQVAGPSPFESLAPALAVVETLVIAAAEALGNDARSRFERFGGVAEQWIQVRPSGAEPPPGAPAS
jgi:DNA-binding MurR/RpiR family transcriptional regulator